MKNGILFVMLSFVSSIAYADSYDSRALELSNRMLECGSTALDFVKDGYKLIHAEEEVTEKDDLSMPSVARAVTTVTFGKGYRPMQGYTSVAQVEIRTRKTCFGTPAADGHCTEVLENCRRH